MALTPLPDDEFEKQLAAINRRAELIRARAKITEEIGADRARIICAMISGAAGGVFLAGDLLLEGWNWVRLVVIACVAVGITLAVDWAGTWFLLVWGTLAAYLANFRATRQRMHFEAGMALYDRAKAGDTAAAAELDSFIARDRKYQRHRAKETNLVYEEIIAAGPEELAAARQHVQEHGTIPAKWRRVLWAKFGVKPADIPPPVPLVRVDDPAAAEVSEPQRAVMETPPRVSSQLNLPRPPLDMWGSARGGWRLLGPSLESLGGVACLLFVGDLLVTGGATATREDVAVTLGIAVFGLWLTRKGWKRVHAWWLRQD